MPTERLLSVAEAADMCGVKVATMRVWRHNNRGPVSVRMGGKLIYKRTDVQRWIDEQYARTARGDGL